MERLTKPTIGCFKYDLSNFEHKPKEFADYDAFYAYNMAVKRLGEYEDTGLTPEEILKMKKNSSTEMLKRIALQLEISNRLNAESDYYEHLFKKTEKALERMENHEREIFI